MDIERKEGEDSISYYGRLEGSTDIKNSIVEQIIKESVRKILNKHHKEIMLYLCSIKYDLKLIKNKINVKDIKDDILCKRKNEK